jgi:hypothetical protein
MRIWAAIYTKASKLHKSAAILIAYFKLSRRQILRNRVAVRFQLERVFVLLLIKFAWTSTVVTIWKCSKTTFILSLTPITKLSRNAKEVAAWCSRRAQDPTLWDDDDDSYYWSLNGPSSASTTNACTKIGFFFLIESDILTMLTFHCRKKCKTVVNNYMLCKHETKKTGMIWK